MRTLRTLALALLVIAPCTAQPWNKSTETYSSPDNSFHPVISFGSSVSMTQGPVIGGVVVQSPLVWRQCFTVDLVPFGVTTDAKYADIGGLLIITGAADLFLAFRASPASEVLDWTWYQEQALSPFTAGGERSVAFDTIPLFNGTFQICPNAKNYPDNGIDLNTSGPAYAGWNLKLKKWGR